MSEEIKQEGLALLRKPFDKIHISKLPSPTRKQTDDLRANIKLGIRCEECGGWHHKDVIHLDYVGHAALTNRLLDCDPNWNWEPIATDDDGTPLFDKNGGMWIKLTVCGVTRLGYGDAPNKSGGYAIKEAIGDALRNAAMRFGAALDLWHKGDLHIYDNEKDAEQETTPPKGAGIPEQELNMIIGLLNASKTKSELEESRLKASQAKRRMSEKQKDIISEKVEKAIERVGKEVGL